jgi:ABC-type multidrug transport system ATPase subunit
VTPRLQVTGLSKSFGPRRVLRDVSFEVPPSSVVCLVGPNGSGKTTLLKTVCTLLKPDEGRVLVDGADAHAQPRRAKTLLGFASTEDHSFYGRLTSRMNLWFYAQLFGLSQASFQERVNTLTADLDLGDVLDKSFRELSNGQKQRMLLARSLLHDPAILLLDEPHQNLDPNASLKLRTLLRETWPRQRGKAVLVSTHHLDEAARISDRWVVLSDGRVVFNGSFEAARKGDSPEAFFQRLTLHAAAL